MADLDVYIYANRNEYSYNNLAQGAVNPIDFACQQLAAQTSISDYNITLSDAYPGVDDPGIYEFHQNFEYWREGYTYSKGAHIGITDITGPDYTGYADGEPNDQTAFKNPKDAVVGSEDGVTEFFKNIVIQELLHLVIEEDISGVNTEDDEHDLGQVFPDSSDVSPMVTTYVGTHDTHGNCSSNQSFDAYAQTLTGCTLDAVDATFDERGSSIY